MASPKPARGISSVSWSVCGNADHSDLTRLIRKNLCGTADHSDQMASIDPYAGLGWFHRLSADLSCLPEIHSFWEGICWANPDALESSSDFFVSWVWWDGQGRALRGVASQVLNQNDLVVHREQSMKQWRDALWRLCHLSFLPGWAWF